MKITSLFFAVLLSAGSLHAQLSAAAFSQRCESAGLQFSPQLIQQDFKTVSPDSSVSKQYDYAIASADGKIEYRYRLLSSVKDSAGAAFSTQYFFYEAAKIKTGYPQIQIRPYAKQTVEKAYGASGGYSAAFKPGDQVATNFTSCSCFSFYKEGKGMFIIYMLTNDPKILLEEKYAAGLAGVLVFR